MLAVAGQVLGILTSPGQSDLQLPELLGQGAQLGELLLELADAGRAARQLGIALLHVGRVGRFLGLQPGLQLLHPGREGLELGKPDLQGSQLEGSLLDHGSALALGLHPLGLHLAELLLEGLEDLEASLQCTQLAGLVLDEVAALQLGGAQLLLELCDTLDVRLELLDVLLEALALATCLLEALLGIGALLGEASLQASNCLLEGLELGDGATQLVFAIIAGAQVLGAACAQLLELLVPARDLALEVVDLLEACSQCSHLTGPLAHGLHELIPLPRQLVSTLPGLAQLLLTAAQLELAAIELHVEAVDLAQPSFQAQRPALALAQDKAALVVLHDQVGVASLELRQLVLALGEGELEPVELLEAQVEGLDLFPGRAQLGAGSTQLGGDLVGRCLEARSLLQRSLDASVALAQLGLVLLGPGIPLTEAPLGLFADLLLGGQGPPGLLEGGLVLRQGGAEGLQSHAHAVLGLHGVPAVTLHELQLARPQLLEDETVGTLLQGLPPVAHHEADDHEQGVGQEVYEFFHRAARARPERV